MLITDQLIYIHQPKTGRTFVHDLLFKAFGIEWKWYHVAKFNLMKQVSYQTMYDEEIVGGAKQDSCADVESKWHADRT